MIEKVLIANRGEIALRIHRACKEIGVKTVAVHSTADRDAMHVRLADESICVGPPSASESYLNKRAIIAAAELSNADAIHPGYGFLAENSEFAAMVEDHDMVFIGPTPEHITLMGDKIEAKKTVKHLGIPVVPGSDGALKNPDQALALAQDIGFPVLIKATAGGGGKGMQVIHTPQTFHEQMALAQAEAKTNFGNPDVFLEKYLQNPRHIEFQILGDPHGNVVHLGERDCSLQRRHQKIWEEAPSPAISMTQRQEFGEVVTQAMKKIGYRGVGTLEFLYENENFYFIEMNTRIQVEHPVTEMITGVDLVKEQLRVAMGYPLSFAQKDISFQGHAIECRINAEHPETFVPSPGTIEAYHAPGGYGVRVDSALYSGYQVPPYYDSLVAKLIVHGATRQEALMRVNRALQEYVIGGVKSTLPLHARLAQNPQVIQGTYDIKWLEAWIRSGFDLNPRKESPQ